MTDLLLQAKGLSKSFKQGRNIVSILINTDFTLVSGEIVALIGPSGCGKTTFLHLIGVLDLPDSGKIFIDGKSSGELNDYERTLCRRNNIGFIYQFHNLLEDFTALANVMLPLQLQGQVYEICVEKSKDLLKKFNLEDRIMHYPTQLSGGEQQRVAIARSMIHDPQLILADEPTGNLDQANADRVMDILISNVRRLQKSLVIVTHNDKIARYADRILTIKDGKLRDIS